MPRRRPRSNPAASPPSSGYDETNQRLRLIPRRVVGAPRRSGWCGRRRPRRPPRSPRPASPTRERGRPVRAGVGGAVCADAMSGRGPADCQQCRYASGMPRSRHCRASTSSSGVGSSAGSVSRLACRASPRAGTGSPPRMRRLGRPRRPAPVRRRGGRSRGAAGSARAPRSTRRRRAGRALLARDVRRASTTRGRLRAPARVLVEQLGGDAARCRSARVPRSSARTSDAPRSAAQAACERLRGSGRPRPCEPWPSLRPGPRPGAAGPG